MKIKKALIRLSLFFLITSCNNDNKGIGINPGRSYVLHGSDTVNVTDEKGLKQGVWYTFDALTHTVKDTIVYKDGKVVH